MCLNTVTVTHIHKIERRKQSQVGREGEKVDMGRRSRRGGEPDLVLGEGKGLKS